MTDFLPFALPDIGEEEIAEVVEVLHSGWLTTGPKVKKFEREFEEFMEGGVYAVAVNSATAGLHLALEAVGVGSGDEVITTIYTFTATAEVIRYFGANPVFVDIDPKTMNIDHTKIEPAITSRTKVIIPVHFAGLACDMDAILEIAGRHNIRVVEDAAHALPSIQKEKLIGTFDSDATVFSFYVTKAITTGEGGMIITKNSKIAERCRIMRFHGINRDVFERYRSEKPAWYYEVIEPAYKYNMTDIAAAIGIHQLKKVKFFQLKREEIAKRYNEAFYDLPVILPPKAPIGDVHAWHLYVLRLTKDAPVSRDRFIELMAQKGIGCSVHFIPLHLHPYWRDTFCLKPDDFPMALEAYSGAVSLPIYTKMTDLEVERVIKAVREILDGS